MVRITNMRGIINRTWLFYRQTFIRCYLRCICTVQSKLEAIGQRESFINSLTSIKRLVIQKPQFLRAIFGCDVVYLSYITSFHPNKTIHLNCRYSTHVGIAEVIAAGAESSGGSEVYVLFFPLLKITHASSAS